MGFDLLPLTLNELWAIHDYVRQHDKLGQEWDRDFAARVMEGILEAQKSPTCQSSLFVQEENELWMIDRQVPSAHMTGTQPVGRELLLKVMKLIVKMRERGEQDGNTDAGQGSDQSTPRGAHKASPSR